MTYHNRMPIGAVGNTSTEPPRYVPGRSAVKPLDCRPLSECDTLPIPALPMPRVVYRRPQRHSRLYWLAWDAWWGVVGHLDSLRSDWGWVGEVAVMVLCAVAVCAVALAVVLWGLR